MTHSAGAFCPACNRILHTCTHTTRTHTHIRIYICTEGWRGRVASDQNDVIRFSWHLYCLSLSLSHWSPFFLPSCLLSHSTFCLPPSACLSFSFLFLSFFLLLLLRHYQIRSVSLLLHWASIQFCCWDSHPLFLIPLFPCYSAFNLSPIHPSPVVL